MMANHDTTESESILITKQCLVCTKQKLTIGPKKLDLYSVLHSTEPNLLDKRLSKVLGTNINSDVYSDDLWLCRECYIMLEKIEILELIKSQFVLTFSRNKHLLKKKEELVVEKSDSLQESGKIAIGRLQNTAKIVVNDAGERCNIAGSKVKEIANEQISVLAQRKQMNRTELSNVNVTSNDSSGKLESDVLNTKNCSKKVVIVMKGRTVREMLTDLGCKDIDLSDQKIRSLWPIKNPSNVTGVKNSTEKSSEKIMKDADKSLSSRVNKPSNVTTMGNSAEELPNTKKRSEKIVKDMNRSMGGRLPLLAKKPVLILPKPTQSNSYCTVMPSPGQGSTHFSQRILPSQTYSVSLLSQNKIVAHDKVTPEAYVMSLKEKLQCMLDKQLNTGVKRKLQNNCTVKPNLDEVIREPKIFIKTETSEDVASCQSIITQKEESGKEKLQSNGKRRLELHEPEKTIKTEPSDTGHQRTIVNIMRNGDTILNHEDFLIEFNHEVFAKEFCGTLVCKMCKEKFDRIETCEKHFNAVHWRRLEFICGLCDEIVKSSNEAESHLIDRHEKRGHDISIGMSSKFMCGICDAQFDSHAMCFAHMDVHAL